jgi:hypothetical protein
MTPATLAVKGGTIGREMTGKFGLKVASYRYFYGSFTCRKSATWYRTAFTSPPKEGALRILFALKNPTALAGFEPANLGTKRQHATSRPSKPLRYHVTYRQVPRTKTIRPGYSCWQREREKKQIYLRQ